MEILDKKLKNGVNLQILNSSSFASSKITVKFNAGYLSVPREKNQIAHVLEHIIYDFSPEDREWLAEIGAIKNAQTWEEYTRYFVEVLPEYFEKAIDVLLKNIENPQISKETVEREIKNVRSEFSSRRRTVLNRVFDQKMEEIFPNSVSDTTGSMSLENITIDDVRAHYDQFYTTDNARVFIFGDFSKSQILKIIKKLENFNLPRGEEKTFPKVKISEKRGAKIAEDGDKIHFVFLSPFENMKFSVRQRATFEILRCFLTDSKTGKLYRELRNEGLLYYVGWAVVCSRNSLCYSVMSFSADEGKFNEINKVIKKWILWAENGEFSVEELEKIKISAKNSLRMNVRRIDEKSLWYRDEFLDFVGYNCDDLIAEFDKITKQDVVELANLAFEHFDEGGWR